MRRLFVPGESRAKPRLGFQPLAQTRPPNSQRAGGKRSTASSYNVQEDALSIARSLSPYLSRNFARRVINLPTICQLARRWCAISSWVTSGRRRFRRILGRERQIEEEEGETRVQGNHVLHIFRALGVMFLKPSTARGNLHLFDESESGRSRVVDSMVELGTEDVDVEKECLQQRREKRLQHLSFSKDLLCNTALVRFANWKRRRPCVAIRNALGFKDKNVKRLEGQVFNYTVSSRNLQNRPRRDLEPHLAVSGWLDEVNKPSTQVASDVTH
ncbi:hypothetical protein C8J56DRAFT_899874 [Mycena floridula]|nr:hypothetical protein C8J56DRAFT_899874 [Mycena floridula]